MEAEKIHHPANSNFGKNHPFTKNIGGGLKYFLFSPRKLGKIPILTHIFQVGLNHQLETFITFGLQPVSYTTLKNNHMSFRVQWDGWVRFNSFSGKKGGISFRVFQYRCMASSGFVSFDKDFGPRIPCLWQLRGQWYRCLK